MELVGMEGAVPVPDKAEEAAGPWADDLREWIGGLAGAGVASAGGAMEGARATRDRLFRILEQAVMGEDWPVIVRAHQAASAGHWRGLITLDAEWGRMAALRGPLAQASLRAGQRQLGRMRPMRGARVVQRYIEAVESGRAHGWHPVVYGMLLAVHAIPLRQGLAHHAMQVASVLGRALGPAGAGAEPERLGFEAQVAREVPRAIDRALEAGGARSIQPCPA